MRSADIPSRLYVLTALTQAFTNVVRFAEVLMVCEKYVLPPHPPVRVVLSACLSISDRRSSHRWKEQPWSPGRCCGRSKRGS